MSMILSLLELPRDRFAEVEANEDLLFEMLEGESEIPGAQTDLDKAWHGIHFLLNGSAWDGDPPLNFLLHGGKEFGDDVGYGKARYLEPGEVLSVASALEGVVEDDFRGRFDATAFSKADIYPNIWDRSPEDDDMLGYLLEYFETLKGFVLEVKERGTGLIICLT